VDDTTRCQLVVLNSTSKLHLNSTLTPLLNSSHQPGEIWVHTLELNSTIWIPVLTESGWKHFIQISSIYHPHIIQISSTYHPHFIQILSRYHPHIVQISATYHPDIIHISSRYHPNIIHISSRYHPHIIHISSRYYPHIVQISVFKLQPPNLVKSRVFTLIWHDYRRWKLPF